MLEHYESPIERKKVVITKREVPDLAYYDEKVRRPETDETQYTKSELIAKLKKAMGNGSMTLEAGTLEAIKHDAGKTDWSILPIAASEEIIKVFEFGAKKYARGNYKENGGLAYSRVLNSLLRHTYAFMKGEDKDPETGLSHMAHAGCNVYMLLTYELDKEHRFNNDDREDRVMT